MPVGVACMFHNCLHFVRSCATWLYVVFTTFPDVIQPFSRWSFSIRRSIHHSKYSCLNLSIVIHSAYVFKYVQLPLDNYLQYVLLKLQSLSNPFVCWFVVVIECFKCVDTTSLHTSEAFLCLVSLLSMTRLHAFSSVLVTPVCIGLSVLCWCCLFSFASDAESSHRFMWFRYLCTSVIVPRDQVAEVSNVSHYVYVLHRLWFGFQYPFVLIPFFVFPMSIFSPAAFVVPHTKLIFCYCTSWLSSIRSISSANFKLFIMLLCINTPVSLLFTMFLSIYTPVSLLFIASKTLSLNTLERLLVISGRPAWIQHLYWTNLQFFVPHALLPCSLVEAMKHVY